MKRTVKAWALLSRDGLEVVTLRKERRNLTPFCPGERKVPGVFTYDDGKPAKRRKRGAK